MRRFKRLTELLVYRRILAMRLWKLAILSLGLILSSSLPAQNIVVAKPARLRVSQGVAEKNVVYKVPPRYPIEAKEKHITGDVILGVTIDHSGSISELKVISGDPVLAQAAADAVKQWKYKPYLLNGEPVLVDTTVKITFRM